jgi:hypothetical protein
MVSGRTADAGKRLGIGLAMMAGSLVLFWLSSSATVRLVRSPSGVVAGTFERQLFGLIPHSRSELSGILTVNIVRGESGSSGMGSGTNDRLFFVTAAGPVDLGQVQDMFVRDALEIAEYLADQSLTELSLSSTARTREQLRFLFAQFVGALLALGGAGLATTGLRGLVREAFSRAT